MSSHKNTVPNIWSAQENLIYLYRIGVLGLSTLVVLLLVLCATVSFQDPVVVTKVGKAREFYIGSRENVKVEKEDVEVFVREYLAALYKWQRYDVVGLKTDIAPFSVDGLVEKIVTNVEQKIGKLRERKLEQDISFLEVKILSDRVVVSFLRVMKIDGVPLSIPTQLTMSLVQGSRTKANPIGLYVSGILEHEVTK